MSPMSPGSRSLLRVSAVVLAVGAVLVSTLSIVGVLGRESVRIDRTYPGIRAIDIDVGAESVEIVAGAGSRTQIRRVVSWSLGRPTVSQRRHGDRLVVRSSCPISFGRGCGGTLRLAVPAATEVRADVSGASITVGGMSGVLVLTSSAGSVRGRGLVSPDVTASSSAGSVSLTFAVPPRRVSTESSAGSVQVLVPRGSETYRVDASSSAGSSKVSVRTDPGSSRTIKARSSAGSVRVAYLERP